MSRKPIIAGALLIFFAILVGGLLIANFSGLKYLSANSQIDFNTTPPISNQKNSVKELNDAFVEIAKAVTPSIVYIDVTGEAKNSTDKGEDFKFFFGPDFNMDDAPVHGTGSGVIISKDGYIMTNNHVVKNATDKGIKVILTDKREFTAKLIGADPVADIAVIKIEAENLTVASMGNSEQVQVGQWVLAIGNPLGLNNTVTSGIVSALGRNIPVSGDSYAINNFIQTDAVINPGNSGGALVDINGLVIGINAAIKTTNGYYQGYGFAIPVNMAKDVASELIKNGKIERGYIGVSIKDVDSKEAKGLGLDKAKGVLVQNVLKGGAGDDAGLKTGDVILSVDGKEVDAANQLQTLIGAKKPGEEVTLVVFRDGKSFNQNVVLKPRVESKDLINDSSKPREGSSDIRTKTFENLGFVVSDLPNSVKKDFNIEKGVQVTNVKNYSEAFNRGLRAGMVILEADKISIESVEQLDEILNKKGKGDVLVLKVMLQNKEIMLIAIEL
ncbi:MAG TPA: Do family serine endopeptidase [Ignavibacteria bacterium]|jgi:serine protease Do